MTKAEIKRAIDRILDRHEQARLNDIEMSPAQQKEDEENLKALREALENYREYDEHRKQISGG